MNLTKLSAAAMMAFLTTITATVPSSAAPSTQCVALNDGVEYRAFLPDKRRFVYIAVKVLPGVFPSVFVIIDKNYVSANGKINTADPVYQWWIDRSKPMAFSADKVRIRWQEGGTWTYVTNWFETPAPTEFSQQFRGLDAVNGHFEGTGSADTNTFTFQTRIEMSGFSGDMFEVKLPDVSFDGVTVTPPIVHFDRDGKNAIAKC